MTGIHQMFLTDLLGRFEYELTTSENPDIEALATAAGWNGVSLLDITIPSGNTISSSVATLPALDLRGLPAGSTLTNEGTINGKGGAGGAGGFNTGNASDGSTGGIGLITDKPLVVTNNGTINGGNGGNGGNAATRTCSIVGTLNANCSGGLGCLLSCHNGQCGNNTGATGATGGSTGSNGNTGGAGSQASCGNNVTCAPSCVGLGCNGFKLCTRGSPGAGGLAGAAVSGNSNITWLVTGTINGAQV